MQTFYSPDDGGTWFNAMQCATRSLPTADACVHADLLLLPPLLQSTNCSLRIVAMLAARRPAAIIGFC